MTITGPQRLLLLSGIAVGLAIVIITRWISGWGLVTIHVKDAPVGKVISSIARQAHVRVESALDPTRVVSMDVDKVPLAEALEVLTIRLDASWRAVLLAAPGTSELQSAILQLRASGKIDGWLASHYPDRGMGAADVQAINPASLEWKAEGPELELSKLLDEAAQKTGVMTALPKEWNPTAPRLPKPAAVSTAISELAGSVRGKSATIFLITERGRRGGPQESPPPPWETPPDAIPRATPRPEWIEQRQEAWIRKLPAAKRAEARKEMEETRAFFASIKDLTPEERRAKIRERMSNPDVAEKIEEQRLLRDSKMTAQQRIQRAVGYVKRKAAIQASGR